MVQPHCLLGLGSEVLTEFASWMDSIVSAEARFAILNSHLVMWKVIERRGSKLKHTTYEVFYDAQYDHILPSEKDSRSSA